MAVRALTTWTLVAAAVAVTCATPPRAALADGLPSGPVERTEGPQPMPPGFLDGIDVVEKLGQQVPLDARFLDHEGREVTLGSVVRGDLPVLVTFNYSSCPQLCDVHLKAVVDALAQARLTPGRQFRLVTIILAPSERPARAARTRQHYVDRLKEKGGAVVGDGWTFLVSRDGKDEAAIASVAAATGFGFRWVADQAQYAHPATVIALSAKGVVTRYLHGVALTPDELDRTIIKAGLAEPSASAGFLVACFHWAPDARVAWGVALMRYGALCFVAILLVAVVVFVRRRSRALPGVTPS